MTHQPEYMLTTVDNPFDPWTQWDEWFAYDMNSGYNTPGLLARVARSSSELSDADQHHAIQSAIEEIVRENLSGVHRKVSEGQLQQLKRESSIEDTSLPVLGG